ncbi:MAG TPA: hypothetical protein VIT23_04300 [Terrimicrobiaceae bacterium]
MWSMFSAFWGEQQVVVAFRRGGLYLLGEVIAFLSKRQLIGQ